jgi:hypothetical protein
MKHQSITSLPPAPAADRGHRMLEYTVMMSIRVLCLVSLLWVRGGWILIPAAGAVFQPYFAVVVANVARTRPSEPERPGSIVRMDGVPGAATWEASADPAGTAADDAGQAPADVPRQSEHPQSPSSQPGASRPTASESAEPGASVSDEPPARRESA